MRTQTSSIEFVSHVFDEVFKPRPIVLNHHFFLKLFNGKNSPGANFPLGQCARRYYLHTSNFVWIQSIFTLPLILFVSFQLILLTSKNNYSCNWTSNLRISQRMFIPVLMTASEVIEGSAFCNFLSKLFSLTNWRNSAFQFWHTNSFIGTIFVLEDYLFFRLFREPRVFTVWVLDHTNMTKPYILSAEWLK